MNKLVKQIFLACSVLFLFAGCKTTGGYIGIGIKPQPAPPPPVVVATKPAPPAHAPAHGRRAKERHHYRYYPDLSVYFDSGRKLYFYISSGRWTVSATLPSSITLKAASSVQIELGTENPYEYHDEHAKKYPPGQAKKKNKHKNNNGRWDRE